jgi:hypothetical protein
VHEGWSCHWPRCTVGALGVRMAAAALTSSAAAAAAAWSEQAGGVTASALSRLLGLAEASPRTAAAGALAVLRSP